MKKLNKTLTMLVAVLLVVVMAFAACKPETPDNPTEPTVESIAVDTTGAKTVYAYGEKFSTEGPSPAHAVYPFVTKANLLVTQSPLTSVSCPKFPKRRLPTSIRTQCTR